MRTRLNSRTAASGHEANMRERSIPAGRRVRARRPRQTDEPRRASGSTRAFFQTSTIEPVNVFSPTELQAARERLTQGDGWHRLLARLGGDEARDIRMPMPESLTSPGFLRRHRASLATVVLYLALAIIPGLIISIFADQVT